MSCVPITHSLTGLQADVARMTGELEAAQNALKEEQLNLGNANVQSDTLRRESMNLDAEGRKLRQSWEEKVPTCRVASPSISGRQVYNLKKAEEDRDHFKVEAACLTCPHSSCLTASFVCRLNCISWQNSMPNWSMTSRSV